jgi:hypothetical protein
LIILLVAACLPWRPPRHAVPQARESRVTYYGRVHLVHHQQRTNCIPGIFISVYPTIGFFEPFEKRYTDAPAIPKIISDTSSTRDSKVRVLRINKKRYEADEQEGSRSALNSSLLEAERCSQPRTSRRRMTGNSFGR